MAKDDVNTILIVAAIATGGYFLYKASSGLRSTATGAVDLLGGAGSATGSALGLVGSTASNLGSDLNTAGNMLRTITPAASVITGIQPFQSLRNVNTGYSLSDGNSFNVTSTTSSSLRSGSVVSPYLTGSMPLIGIGGLVGGIELLPTIVTAANSAYTWVDKTIFGGALPAGYNANSASSTASTSVKSSSVKTTPNTSNLYGFTPVISTPFGNVTTTPVVSSSSSSTALRSSGVISTTKINGVTYTELTKDAFNAQYAAQHPTNKK